MSGESEYQRKRDFGATSEPPAVVEAGDVDPLTAPPGDTFVIQQHYATRLHHDLRLEMMNGQTPVLVSWAVPKELPRERGEKHLAIRTEDHPFEYGSFQGSIPEGEYGGGEVRIYDEGSYEMVNRSDDRITFRLEGRRLRGVYHLVKTHFDEDKEQWLALLSEDQRPPADKDPAPSPMLATLTDEAFDDAEWGFEPKWDGIRALAVCNTTTTLITRNARDVTAGYPELQEVHVALVALDAMIDGEIVAFENGQPSFQRLQQRMHVRDPEKVERLARQIPVVYMAFDILYLDGHDLTQEPLRERRRRLEEILVPTDNVQFSPMVEGAGIALFEAAEAQDLEGILAKKLDSKYEPGGRSRAWLKVKLVYDVDVVIVGWTEGSGNRAGNLGSLVMAVYDGDDLRYVGNVGTGFNRASLEDALNRLQGLGETGPAFDSSVVRSTPELRKVHWVEPELVAMIEHRQLTAAGRLRAPAFKGFREDKSPRECTIDQLATETTAG